MQYTFFDVYSLQVEVELQTGMNTLFTKLQPEHIQEEIQSSSNWFRN